MLTAIGVQYAGNGPGRYPKVIAAKYRVGTNTTGLTVYRRVHARYA